MTDALDRELRLALFAHIGRLRDESGGLLPWARLSEGMVFRGQRVPILNPRRGIYKPGNTAGAALTIVTSPREPYEDEHDREGGRLIYKYQGTNPDSADNRALRRAFERGLPLLYLVGIEKGLYEPVFPCRIVRDDPRNLRVELLADAEGSIARSFSDDPLEAAPLKEYATRQVQQRLHQRRFRHLVLSAYGQSCAMCRLKQPPLLDAAHILPDRDERGHPEVTNGLALCKIHHSAYDVGILGVDSDYRIHLRQEILQEHDGPMLKHGLQEMHGLILHVPRSQVKRPSRDYLAERFARFLAA